ncbi:MAG: hypothetical protein AVDCRST_MAG03-2640 [uncultured Rubrobacteraceae bacterium]|uniref:Uncharacterized protein n=1 Tax=uncultured Rubrobacteraceae bacterium TaxID=349277 RepID=A0A6J4PXN3_9ACTN|nr:MAG: hypothetical protein AVDCRST_MAG03-2640 [uncultured Rubrobacteraceae bacterium]
MFKLWVALVLALEVVGLLLLTLAVPGVPIWVLIPLVPLTVGIALVARRELESPAHRLRRLSPEAIVGHRPRRRAESPESLSRSIVERANEIHRSLTELPADETRVEMCALGYRACANDMITLTHLVNEALPNAPLLHRLRLRRARKRAIDALAEAREAIPSEALRTSRQEQQ